MVPSDWQRTRSEVESDLRVFRVRRDAAVSPRTGDEHEFVVLESPDWVAVVALTDDGGLVLVRQFRHGLRRVTLELPGGLVDEGMTPLEAARAELRQETGYGDGEWSELGRLAPLPAVFTNHVHVFLARGVRVLGKPEPDAAEDITTHVVPVAEVRRMVSQGEIVHAPVVAALFLWELAEGTGGSAALALGDSRLADGAPAGDPAPEDAAGPSPDADPGSLRERVMAQLRSHFTATVATVGGPEPADGARAAAYTAADRGAAEAADSAIGAAAEAGRGAEDATADRHGGRAADAGWPHAATVFYAVDRRARLVFLSKGDSRHGRHIGAGAPVAVTVAREYSDWRDIQGIQVWGWAEPLRGMARTRALALYLSRFTFVSALLEDPRLAARLRGLEVYRVTPRRAALTDNRRGPFGREVLEEL